MSKLILLLALAASLSVAQSQFLSQQQMVTIAFNSLNHCERAIWNCCQTDRANTNVPTQCFEQNGCFGLHWLGAQACSSRMINAVATKLQGTVGQLIRNEQIRQQQHQQNQLRFGFFP